LDVHLTQVLGAWLMRLADTTHGWPQSPQYPAPENWETALRLHGQALLAYRDSVYEATGSDGVEAARVALHWVADNLPDLWD